jgi:hypothetical protein
VSARQFEVARGVNQQAMPQMALPSSHQNKLLSGTPQEEAKQEEI